MISSITASNMKKGQNDNWIKFKREKKDNSGRNLRASQHESPCIGSLRVD